MNLKLGRETYDLKLLVIEFYYVPKLVSRITLTESIGNDHCFVTILNHRLLLLLKRAGVLRYTTDQLRGCPDETQADSIWTGPTRGEVLQQVESEESRTTKVQRFSRLGLYGYG